MSDEKTKDFAIEEFKALRDEVKRCETESLSTTLYVFTAVVLAAGLAEKQGLPKQAVPILIQIALLWAMNRYHASTSLRKRLSTYIQVMLEPVLPGIRWEGRNETFEIAYRPRHYFMKNPGTNRWLHLLTQLFPLLTVVGLYVSINAVIQFQVRDLSFYAFVVVLFVLHLMSMLLMLNCVFFQIPEASYRDLWRCIKQREEAPEAQPSIEHGKPTERAEPRRPHTL